MEKQKFSTAQAALPRELDHLLEQIRQGLPSSWSNQQRRKHSDWPKPLVAFLTQEPEPARVWDGFAI